MRKKIQPKARKDDGDAFIRESDQAAGTPDDLAQLLAQEFLRSASSGEDMEEDTRDEVLAEELGGPFIESGPEEEFGTTLEPELGETAWGALGKAGARQETRRRERASGEPSALPEAIGSLALAGADELEEAAETEDEESDESDLREQARLASSSGERPHLLVDLEPASRVGPPSVSTDKG